MSGAPTFDALRVVSPNVSNLSMSSPLVLPMSTTVFTISTVGTFTTHSRDFSTSERVWSSVQM